MPILAVPPRPRVRCLTAAVATALAAGALPAQTFTLTFDDPGVGNYSPFASDYGSQAGLIQVSARGRTGWGAASVVAGGALLNWNTGFNDLVDVGFIGNPSICCVVGEMRLAPLGGRRARLDAVDVGAFSNASATVALRLYDDSFNLLYSSLGNTVGSTTHASFAPMITATGPLRLQWSRLDLFGAPSDAWNTGIDNLQFTVLAPTAVVPEPGTWVLLGTGLLALGAVAHRRRSTA